MPLRSGLATTREPPFGFAPDEKSYRGAVLGRSELFATTQPGENSVITLVLPLARLGSCGLTQRFSLASMPFPHMGFAGGIRRRGERFPLPKQPARE
jgi:hypothetical protein